MSTEERSKKKSSNKRKAETDISTLKSESDTIKTMRFTPDEAKFNNSKSKEVGNTEFVDEALRVLEDIRRNLNTETSDSSETSDCEHNDNESNQQLIENAHFLGYKACIQETFRFLDYCGIPKSDPLYEQLKKHFTESSNRIGI